MLISHSLVSCVKEAIFLTRTGPGKLVSSLVGHVHHKYSILLTAPMISTSV